ncbi:MAG: RAMP superfamily CRISPR-associated protein [Candidatus Jordarchaeaceae archaeon]
MKLTFKINLLSDYHIGAGYGSGIVDSKLLKDKDGMPVIRGTTLSGLLRQGMWELLQLPLLAQHRKCEKSGIKSSQPDKVSYCSAEDINSMCPVCRILGTPAYAKKWSISSANVENSAMVIPEKIVWRSRVSPRTRTAEARKLFREETASSGINFIFTVSNESNDRQTLEEAAFIVAAFRMMRNLGSSRRRGKGHCQIHLVSATPELEKKEDTSLEDVFLNFFREKWLENKELDVPQRTTQIKLESGKPQKKSFRVILLTEEPLLIADRSESGNRYHTNTYIPGYTFLGSLAWRAAERCDLSDKAVYENFIRLFRRGGVKVSPLYPAFKLNDNVYSSIPSPQDFLTCKLNPEFQVQGHGVEGFATHMEEPESCEICGTPLEPIVKFLPIREKPETITVGLEAIDVALREEMHITIKPETGITEKGVLFGYVSLESGQYFNGCLEVEDWINFANFMGIDTNNKDITFELRVGKAFSRGHGRIKVWLHPEDNPENIFLGKPLEERVTDLTQPITMTLITDTILLDNWGRFLNTLDKGLLEKLLGVEVEVINTYVKPKNIDGFNTHIGLPKWRDTAIIAGSSIGFKIKNPNNRDTLLKRLKEIEREGVGMRREEGFGRVAFNHPIYSKNKEVNTRIVLPEHMRTSKIKNKVRIFEKWWKEHLMRNVDPKDFDGEKWIAISRWLRSNAKKSIKDIKGGIDNFHVPERPLNDLIVSKKAYRDKKKFLEEEQKGKEKLKSLLDVLSERLSENEEIKEYLQIRAVEILADFIAPLKKEGEE